MSYLVVVADPINPRGLELLRSAPGFEVVSAVGDTRQRDELVGRAAALVVRSETRVTGELMVRAPGLKVVARAGIGVDNIDVEAATSQGIAVVNAPGGNTVSAAEHTWALLLALVRRVPAAAASMRAGQWGRQQFVGTELSGKTLSIIGLGRIGQQILRFARAFGMETLAHDPYVAQDWARELHITLVSLEEALMRADVVTLHLPFTPETVKLIDGSRLALMKPSAVLINAARGGLIDEAALFTALEAGQLAGAALDVFDTEPLAAESPLRSSGKIVLTPHLAASTVEAQERVAVEVCDTVRHMLRTGDVRGAVNYRDLANRAPPLVERSC